MQFSLWYSTLSEASFFYFLVPQIVANRAVPPEFKVPLSFRHYIEWFDNPSEEIRATYKRSLGGNWPDHKLILGEFDAEFHRIHASTSSKHDATGTDIIFILSFQEISRPATCTILMLGTTYHPMGTRAQVTS